MISSGNNAAATIDGRTTGQSEGGQVFKYIYNVGQDPRVGANRHAAAVNAFYVINSVHDVTYRYGFVERAFNFQNNNFGRGGNQGDRVIITVQNSEQWNNAFFSTPPE